MDAAAEVPSTSHKEEADDMNDKKETSSVDDEYGYVKRDHFTSEAFKIEIGNIPKHFGFGECKKLLKKKLKLNPHKIKYVPRINKIYVTFKNEEDKCQALERLHEFNFRGKVLQVKTAKPKQDAMAMKRPHTQDPRDVGETLKQRKLETNQGKDNMAPQDILKDSVTKWHSLPYQQQLDKKQENMMEFLRSLRQKMGKLDLDIEVFVWIMKNKSNLDGLCCPLKPIIASPVITHYRNKSEFTVGLNTSGEKTVGYRLGKYRDQTCAVENANEIVILPDLMKSVASKFQNYVRTTKKEPYNPQTYEGHWRQLTLRTTLSEEVMAIVHTSKNDQDEEEMKTEKKNLLKHFQESGVTTLFYHSTPTHRQSGTSIEPPELLFGNGFITEKLLGLSFQISADAFFQCNTLAAEILYRTTGEIYLNKTDDANNDTNVEDEDKKIILFDVCCGTGTIGLTLASHVEHVIGIEMSEQAVNDAKQNRKLNGIKNVEFHGGKAEDLLPSLVKKYPMDSNYEIIAIVDPPRPGLHPKVIQTLRRCPLIKRIIYVSCNPYSAITNFIDLCRPKSKRLPGLPFLPESAQAVDLFPQTPHCELILAFTRTKGKKKCENYSHNEKQTSSSQDVNIEDNDIEKCEVKTIEDVSEPSETK